jgi:hypothetical protein
MPRDAIIFLTHRIDRHIRRSYLRLRREAGIGDVHLAFNAGGRGIPRAITALRPVAITPADHARLGHSARPVNGCFGAKGDPDRAILAFHRKFPHYAYYWIVEYDVDFTGHWSDFFHSFDHNEADLLCTNLHRRHVNPDWDWWDILVTPKSSTIRIDGERLRGFFPIARLSSRMLRRIDEVGLAGWDGMYELIWPTVALQSSFVIEDFGGAGEFVRPGNENRWYTSNPSSRSLAPGSFVFRPSRLAPGRDPNRLWHLVKRGFVRQIILQHPIEPLRQAWRRTLAGSRLLDGYVRRLTRVLH